MLEQEARELLQQQRIERDISETRTCAEIAEQMGLAVIREVAPVTTSAGVMSETARLQAENMTRNVSHERAPYFVRLR